MKPTRLYQPIGFHRRHQSDVHDNDSDENPHNKRHVSHEYEGVKVTRSIHETAVSLHVIFSSLSRQPEMHPPLMDMDVQKTPEKQDDLGACLERTFSYRYSGLHVRRQFSIDPRSIECSMRPENINRRAKVCWCCCPDQSASPYLEAPEN